MKLGDFVSVEDDSDIVENIAELNRVTTEAYDDITALKGIETIISDNVEVGTGIDERAAEIADIAVEAICKRLGVVKNSHVLVATEAFGSRNARLEASKLAVESIKSVVSDAVKAVKETIIRIYDAIVKFLKDLYNKATESNIKKAQDNVKAYQGTVPSGPYTKETYSATVKGNEEAITAAKVKTRDSEMGPIKMFATSNLVTPDSIKAIMKSYIELLGICETTLKGISDGLSGTFPPKIFEDFDINARGAQDTSKHQVIRNEYLGSTKAVVSYDMLDTFVNKELEYRNVKLKYPTKEDKIELLKISQELSDKLKEFSQRYHVADDIKTKLIDFAIANELHENVSKGRSFISQVNKISTRAANRIPGQAKQIIDMVNYYCNNFVEI